MKLRSQSQMWLTTSCQLVSKSFLFQESPPLLSVPVQHMLLWQPWTSRQRRQNTLSLLCLKSFRNNILWSKIGFLGRCAQLLTKCLPCLSPLLSSMSGTASVCSSYTACCLMPCAVRLACCLLLLSLKQLPPPMHSAPLSLGRLTQTWPQSPALGSLHTTEVEIMTKLYWLSCLHTASKRHGTVSSFK